MSSNAMQFYPLRWPNTVFARAFDDAIQREQKDFKIANISSIERSFFTISNGNRTEWSPIQSVIIRVITKSDDRAAGVRFVYHENDYRLNWTTRSPIIN